MFSLGAGDITLSQLFTSSDSIQIDFVKPSGFQIDYSAVDRIIIDISSKDGINFNRLRITTLAPNFMNYFNVKTYRYYSDDVEVVDLEKGYRIFLDPPQKLPRDNTIFLIAYVQDLKGNAQKRMIYFSTACNYFSFFWSFPSYFIAYFALVWVVFNTILKIFIKEVKMGRVYDFVTKEGIPGAIVEIYEGQRLVTKAITNENGFYDVQVSKGKYDIKVSARGYKKIPNRNLKIDWGSINLYLGGEISMKRNWGVINFDIPLVPLNRRHKIGWKARIKRLFAKLRLFIESFPVLSVAIFHVLVFYTHLSSYWIASILIVISLIRNYGPELARGKSGKVVNENGNVITDCKLSISKGTDSDYLNVKANGNGRFKFFVPPGKYRLDLRKSKYEFIDGRSELLVDRSYASGYTNVAPLLVVREA
jgi:hypothetical protein